MSDLTKRLRKDFSDEEYAHAYVNDFLNIQLASQIRALREARGWTQLQLADRAGMKQARISALEDSEFEAWTASTLRRLAHAFDLTLSISFETFSRKILEISQFRREALLRTDRAADLGPSTVSIQLVVPTAAQQNVTFTSVGCGASNPPTNPLQIRLG